MSKKTLIIGVGAVIVLGFLGWYGYSYYYLGYQQANEYKKIEKQYVDAMTADVYGGKTPKETLDLFVAALKKGDIDLASKYFMLDDNLSREKWVTRLNDIKNKGLLNSMVNDISTKAKLDLEDIIDKNDYKFVINDKNGIVGVMIDMQFNKYSGIWKIESF